jgi:DNA-binding CsgD family transcriptional regulator
LCTDDFLTGRWNECLQLAEEGIELCAVHGYRLLAAPLRRVQARVVAARGDRNASTLADGAASRGAPLAATSSRFAMVAAGREAVAGCPDGIARELFEEALATPGGERWAFEHARIQLAFGRHLRRHREAAPARRHLHAALATFRRLAADPWAAQARDELRAVGARTADARASTVPMRPALSPQEHEVAGLAASGLTNKQIAVRLHLSPRTISARLYQIFPKLGVTSRAGLRDALSGLATSAAGTAS